jgi:4-amino-4-deoxy-L-arabinose transferase-like glycosyltransferase
MARNWHIHSEADEAFNKECISEAEQTAIKAHYPVGFYTPNFFYPCWLVILTAVIAGFTLALFFLITLAAVALNTHYDVVFFFTTFVVWRTRVLRAPEDTISLGCR